MERVLFLSRPVRTIDLCIWESYLNHLNPSQCRWSPLPFFMINLYHSQSLRIHGCSSEYGLRVSNQLRSVGDLEIWPHLALGMHNWVNMRCTDQAGRYSFNSLSEDHPPYWRSFFWT